MSRALVIIPVALAALIVWHKFDVSSAVKGAVVEYVAETELAALRAEAEEMRKNWAAAVDAGSLLRGRLDAARAEAETYEERVRAYEAEHAEPADCRVTDDVLGLLRSE